MIQEINFPYEADIDADLNRTCPHHFLFRNKEAVGIESLKNILKALSLRFPEMGYCQGINFIAAAFLI